VVNFIIGSFLILHGLVPLLYFGHSARYYELTPRLAWPDESWMLGKHIKTKNIRSMASILCIVAALGFIFGGIGYITEYLWIELVIGTTAVFSSLIYLLFWNGIFSNLDAQGGVGVLINLAIIALIFLY